MSTTSAPKGNNPATRTDASADGSGVVRCPGQAALVNECLWNRQPWCLVTVDPEGCCLFNGDELEGCEDGPF